MRIPAYPDLGAFSSEVEASSPEENAIEQSD
jgi:hypothetical protein